MRTAAVIIVNWNTGTLLAKCLLALQNLPEKQIISHIVVVDNNSHDASVAQARHAVDTTVPINFIALKRNVGFAAACNLGVLQIQAQLDENSDIFLLNPDTEVRSGTIQALLSALERHPRVGIVGPRLLNTDSSPQASVRRFPTFSALLILSLKLQYVLSFTKTWQRYVCYSLNYAKEQIVDQVMGAAFMIRRETWREVGPLDDGFWVWFEEVDFCKRAANNNWQTLYTPNGSVIHYGGASFHQLVGWRKIVPWFKSTIRYARKHLGIPATSIIIAVIPVALSIATPAIVIHMWRRRRVRASL